MSSFIKGLFSPRSPDQEGTMETNTADLAPASEKPETEVTSSVSSARIKRKDDVLRKGSSRNKIQKSNKSKRVSKKQPTEEMIEADEPDPTVDHRDVVHRHDEPDKVEHTEPEDEGKRDELPSSQPPEISGDSARLGIDHHHEGPRGEMLCSPVSTFTCKGLTTNERRACQVCLFETDLVRIRNTAICRHHNVRLCLDVREDGDTSPVPEWMCPNRNLSCWDKFHSFYLNQGLWAGENQSITNIMEDWSNHKFRTLRTSCSLYKAKNQAKTKQTE